MIDYYASLKAKIITKERFRELWIKNKLGDKSILFTNGCFDLIHKGHVEYLAKAASLSDMMVVGLNSDNSVTRLKGANRPLQDEQARATVLAAFEFVSYVILFDEDTPHDLIQYLKSNMLVKGSDYAQKDIVGADLVLANGGRVLTIDLVDGYSTTNIVEKIKQHG